MIKIALNLDKIFLREIDWKTKPNVSQFLSEVTTLAKVHNLSDFWIRIIASETNRSKHLLQISTSEETWIAENNTQFQTVIKINPNNHFTQLPTRLMSVQIGMLSNSTGDQNQKFLSNIPMILASNGLLERSNIYREIQEGINDECPSFAEYMRMYQYDYEYFLLDIVCSDVEGDCTFLATGFTLTNCTFVTDVPEEVLGCNSNVTVKSLLQKIENKKQLVAERLTTLRKSLEKILR